MRKKRNFLKRFCEKIIPNLDQSKLVKFESKLKSNPNLVSQDLTKVTFCSIYPHVVDNHSSALVEVN